MCVGFKWDFMDRILVNIYLAFIDGLWVASITGA